MAKKTLAEAAAEVLNASRSGAAKEPMHKLDNTGSHLDAVHDLGGSSFETPQGGDVGSKAAAAAPSATAPGTPAAVAQEPMHVQNKGTEPNSVKAKKDLEGAL